MHTTLTEPRPVMLRAAVSTGDRPVPVHDAGAMDIVCTYCGARTWRSEKIRCCGDGAVQLDPLPQLPPELSAAILAPHVRQHMRSYNMSLAMASVGHENVSLPDGTFVLAAWDICNPEQVPSTLLLKYICWIRSQPQIAALQ